MLLHVSNLRCLLLAGMISCVLGTGPVAATSSEPGPETDPAEAGLSAYVEERYQEALASWRGIVERGDADGVLLYRFAFALEHAGGSESEIREIRDRARRALGREADERGGPVRCYYLTALEDDEAHGAELAGACYDRFRHLAESGDFESRFFLTRLAAGDEARGAEREDLLRGLVAEGISSEGPRPRWLASAVEDLGELLGDSGRSEEALAIYAQVLEVRPGDPRVMEARGDTLWRLDRNEEAEAVFRTVVAADPGRGASWVGLALALEDQRRCDEAVPAYRKAAALLPDSATAHDGIGRCIRESDIDGAIVEFREAIRISPDWADPHLNLVEALDRAGRTDEALKEARAAVALAPGVWRGHALLADLLARQGDIEGALDVYRRASTSIADPDLALGVMGHLLTEQGRAAEALEPLNRAVAIDPNYGDWRRYLGAAYESLQRYDEAESSYRKAIELEPEDAVHHGYLGSLLEDLGRSGEALEVYTRAEELSPDYAFAVERIARVRNESDGPQAVVDYLEPRLDRFEGNAPIQRLAGIAYDALGRREEAERALRRATVANPEYDLGFDSLAIVLIEAGRLNDAISELGAGLHHQPDSAQLNFRMGAVLDDAGRPAEAEAYLLRATELDTDMATAWNSLGVVRDHLGRPEEGLEAFERAIATGDPFPLAQMNLARMHRNLGHVDEAVAAFRQVTVLQPENADAWGLLAEQLVKAGDPGAARDAAESGLRVRPSHAGCRNVLGDALMALDREAEALAAYEAAQDVEVDNEYPFQKQAEILHRKGDYAGEIDVLNRYLGRYPESNWGLRQKGLALFSMRLFPEALDAYRAAVAASDLDWIAWAGVGDSAYKLGRLEEAADAYARTVEIKPDFGAGHAALGEVLAKQEHLGRAVEEYRAAVELGDDPSRVVALAELLRKTGEPEEARKLLEKALEDAEGPDGEHAPGVDRNLVRRALADLFEATSRPGLAVPLLQAVVSDNPKDLASRRRLARALRGAGRLRESAEAVQSALDLDPDDEESISMLKAFPREIVDSEAVLRRTRPTPLEIDPPDVEAVLARFKTADPSIAKLIGDQSVVGWDRYQLRVGEGGLLTQTFHEIQWLLDSTAAEQRGEYRISWFPSREQLEVHRARTHLPDGRVIDAAPEAYHRVSPSDTSTANVYSDSQVLVISLPQIQPGAAIEVQYTKRMKSTLTEREWWSSWTFNAPWPMVESRFVLQSPAEARVSIGDTSLTPNPEKRQDGDWTTYTWIGTHLPAVREEPASPAKGALRGLVRVSSYASWDEIASWFHGLVKPQVELDETAKQTVARLVDGAGDDWERTRRIYDYLQSTSRYVAVALGITSFQPRRALDTFRDGYGDCKDRGTLLIAMLRAAGIRALPAFVATRDHGGIQHGAPSPGQFNHFIVYLPDLAAPEKEGLAPGAPGTFVDATTEHNDLGILPAAVQGIEAFVIDDGRGTFIQTPVSRPRENTRGLERTVEVLPDGAALITDDASGHGHFATWFRDVLARYDEQARKELVHRSVRAEFPKAAEIDYRFTGVDAPGETPRDHETFRVDGLAQRVGRSRVLSLDLLDSVEDILPLSPVPDRTLAYEADVPFVLEEKLTLTLQGEQSFLEWPEPVSLDTPHASLEITFTPDQDHPGKALIVEGRFVLRDRIIPVEDYAGFVSVIERTLSAGHLTFLLR